MSDWGANSSGLAEVARAEVWRVHSRLGASACGGGAGPVREAETKTCFELLEYRFVLGREDMRLHSGIIIHILANVVVNGMKGNET